jgi:hypothetical protein
MDLAIANLNAARFPCTLTVTVTIVATVISGIIFIALIFTVLVIRALQVHRAFTSGRQRLQC